MADSYFAKVRKEKIKELEDFLNKSEAPVAESFAAFGIKNGLKTEKVAEMSIQLRKAGLWTPKELTTVNHKKKWNSLNEKYKKFLEERGKS